MKTKEKSRKYKVEYLIYFLKADRPGPSFPYRKEMVLEEPLEENNAIKTYFENQIARLIAGFNEFPIEDVNVKITSMQEILA